MHKDYIYHVPMFVICAHSCPCFRQVSTLILRTVYLYTFTCSAWRTEHTRNCTLVAYLYRICTFLRSNRYSRNFRFFCALDKQEILGRRSVKFLGKVAVVFFFFIFRVGRRGKRWHTRTHRRIVVASSTPCVRRVVI